MLRCRVILQSIFGNHYIVVHFVCRIIWGVRLNRFYCLLCSMKCRRSSRTMLSSSFSFVRMSTWSVAELGIKSVRGRLCESQSLYSAESSASPVLILAVVVLQTPISSVIGLPDRLNLLHQFSLKKKLFDRMWNVTGRYTVAVVLWFAY